MTPQTPDDVVEALDRLDEIHACWIAVSDLLCPCGGQQCDLHIVSRAELSTLTHLLVTEEARALTKLRGREVAHT